MGDNNHEDEDVNSVTLKSMSESQQLEVNNQDEEPAESVGRYLER